MLIVAGYGRSLEANNFCAECGEHFTLRKARARKIFADAAQDKQEGIQGQWQHESPLKKVLEQIKRSADTDCNAQMMCRAYDANKLGN